MRTDRIAQARQDAGAAGTRGGIEQRGLVAGAWLCLLGAAGLTGCTDLGGKPPLPSGVPTPEAINTPAGARAMYQGAVGTFGFMVGSGGTAQYGAALWSTLDQGMLSDELTVNMRGGTPLDYESNSAAQADFALDSRNLPEQGGASHVGAYNALQTVRAAASQGIGQLAAYDSAEKALRGHLYGLAGYAELYLADLFCSGVPLSTLVYKGDFVYQPGSPTEAVYAHALTQFNAALPLVADSVSWLNLVRVGRGRAFLNLGQYDSAAAAVRAVPDGFRYDVPVQWTDPNSGTPWLIGNIGREPGGADFFGNQEINFGATVADTEGAIGYPYRTAATQGDPRTAVTFVQQNLFGDSLFVPQKYTGLAPLTVASGIEARLIEAEAALHGVPGLPDWLSILNGLRQTVGLGPLSDPGNSPRDTARVRLLFNERAAWLFLDGHRLGDLRRLLRRYGLLVRQVFPTGAYLPQPDYPTYGPDVELPIPPSEHQINPFFTGCLSRGV